MHLVNLTTAGIKKIIGLSFSLFIYSFVIAQDNSPYSRYGLGDVVPSRNVISRGMGGLAIGYSDFQSINFVNPASLANLANTIFDLGGEIDVRTLKSNNSPEKYSSTNTLFSYLQVGFPIATKKMIKKGNFLGVGFGLKPVTRIAYKIQKNERLSGIDSLNTLYEGSGGVNQASISTAFKHVFKNQNSLNIGLNFGYSFGNKDYSTKLALQNDSVIYYKSNTETQTHFGAVFLNAGLQYDIKTHNGLLRLGAYGNFEQKLKASRDNITETFIYDGYGGTIPIDTVALTTQQKGTIILPSSFGAGFTYTNSNWLFGLDMEIHNWASYRYYGEKDAVQNSWIIRTGAQYYPAKTNSPSNKYWSFVKYRAGLYFGPDYIKVKNTRNEYGLSIGATFPLTSLQRIRFGEYVLLNTAFEMGTRGNKQSASVRENITRFSIGISMNARWFQKPKYD